MYAIIATGGKQYKVSEGDIITIEKLGVEAGETVTFDQVIAVNDGTMKVADEVKNATVTASVVKEGRGKKVIVYKYKAKKNKWSISEATLPMIAVIGGSIGAWVGMRLWHHKTMHKKFKYGIPIIIIMQVSLVVYLHSIL